MNKKEYMKKYSKEYYLKNKEKIKEDHLKNKEKIKERSKEWRLKNKEHIKEYYLKNKEKIKEYKKEYQLKNREKLKKIHKEWRVDNKEYIKEYLLKNREQTIGTRKKYRLKNREKLNKRTNEWKLNNKERVKEYTREYTRERRKTDPNFKLLANLRSRIWKILKGANKSKRTMELIGCTLDELWTHLESKFTEGMTRQNHGKWHIDHIMPCVSFDLTNPEQQAKCFHYTNLQPLWAFDNISKGAKIISGDITSSKL
tara:strand:+ start:117 stop:884 length:768 start_codon:yes stop_codon:yes gene_type:complete